MRKLILLFILLLWLPIQATMVTSAMVQGAFTVSQSPPANASIATATKALGDSLAVLFNMGGGGGSVSSVNVTFPSSVFTVTGGPITTSGTIAASFSSQSANQAFMSPNGASGVPSFRAFLPGDITFLTDSMSAQRAFTLARIRDSLGAFAPTRTTNVIPKFNGSALVPSSWTDSSTQLRTTTTDTLIVQHAQMGDALGSSGLDVWWGYKGIINGYGGTNPGFIAGSVGQVGINVASGQGFALSVGAGNLLVADVSGVRINGGFKSATDTITGLSVAGYVTNSANGALGTTPTIPYSALSGTVPTWNQNTTGSAATLTTPRTIATSGDAVGTATSFNGSANILIPTTVSGINGLAIPASKTIVGTNASSQIVDASSATLANNTTGSAATLTTGRTISASGDATGTSAAFNGSAAVTIPLTLASTITAGGPTGGAATVPVITYDAKGRLTAVSTATITPAAIGAQAALSGGTTNALAKWTGSSTLGTGSWTDSASVLRTTTTDTLVSQNATLGNVAYSPAWASQPFRVAKFGWIGNGGHADGAWMIDSIGNLYGNGKNRIELSINGGYDVATFTPTGSRFYGADTISLASKTILGTDGSGKIIDNSATTLANNTTGNAATATKWQTARNLTIGSSTQAQDGTAALTYSLAAIGAQPAGSYLPVNNPVFTGTLSGPTISASTTTYSPAYTGGTITLSGNVSASTANIGALAGTVVASSGSLSSLSGTNLVLGNGSTIPQSTFQAAGSYLPLAAGSGNPLSGQLYLQGGTGLIFNGASGVGFSTAGSNGTWFTNTVTGDLAIRSGSGALRMGPGTGAGASTMDLTASGVEAYGAVKVDGTTTLNSSLTGLATLTSGVVGATVTPSVTSVTATGTGTAISAPNGGISYNGPEIILDKIIIGGSAYTLSAPHAFVAFISTGTAVSMPAGSTDGQMMILSNSGTANILINNRVLSAFSLQTGTSRTMQWYAAGSEWF